MYSYKHIQKYIYIYIYIEREREVFTFNQFRRVWKSYEELRRVAKSCAVVRDQSKIIVPTIWRRKDLLTPNS